VRSARHALSAAALSALVLGGLAAYDGFDFAAVQAAPRPTASIADAASARVLSARGTSPTSAVAPLAARPSPTAAARTTPSAPTVAITAKAAADTSVAAQVLKLVNAERKKTGCKSVTLDTRLTAAAAGHAKDMAAADYFSHTSKDGRTFVDRIKAQGYSKPRSENIAAGQPTVSAVMSAWMKSSGHRANILDCSATQMGAASAKGGSYGIYWVQDFGRG
jgi:uncharacterized protein YkwD